MTKQITNGKTVLVVSIGLILVITTMMVTGPMVTGLTAYGAASSKGGGGGKSSSGSSSSSSSSSGSSSGSKGAGHFGGSGGGSGTHNVKHSDGGGSGDGSRVGIDKEGHLRFGIDPRESHGFKPPGHPPIITHPGHDNQICRGNICAPRIHDHLFHNFNHNDNHNSNTRTVIVHDHNNNEQTIVVNSNLQGTCFVTENQVVDIPNIVQQLLDQCNSVTIVTSSSQ